jgi:hypothetical protein
MKTFNTSAKNTPVESAWVYEQEKRNARKQDKQLRQMKQGRKNLWLSGE